jgi:peptidyl-prolyl cis-trans isomerase B (cyclophilin B)
VPSNEQRRAAAKRKLERRLERQAQRARRRKQFLIAGSVLGVLVAAGAGVGIYYLTRDNGSDTASTPASDASQAATPQAALPPTPKAKPATVSCTYTSAGQPARPVHLPDGAQVSAQGQVKVTMNTNQGHVGLVLNKAESPCTVNNFVSLVNQKFFDNTSCHRLSTADGLKMLQCGDPLATGMGGPGYRFANEYPTDQYAAGDPAIQNPVLYKRGVIAMANSDQPDQPNGGTNGSQFFLVYGDSQLPPDYTIFGTIDTTGLATLDKIAKAGIEGDAPDGKPVAPVDIQSVQIG